MKVWIKGGSTVDLNTNNFLASGGEGSVYVIGSSAYKVYHDPNKMLPIGKINELSAITNPNVIKPNRLLVDKNGKPIGYEMRYIADPVTLCQIFTKGYRERNKITHDKMLKLVRILQSMTTDIHRANILAVDLNELNFLTDKQYKEIYGIDTDSYQTRSYPAPAIMESIRDWTIKGNKWTELSDWYSFAIIAFQMFIGLHPYRGKYHGPIEGYRQKLPSDDPNDQFAVTRRRMQDSISVFDKDVRYPQSTIYPFTAIPPVYMDWFKALFVDRKRYPPPADLVATVAIMAQTITAWYASSAQLEITPMWSLSDTIRYFYDSYGSTLAVTDTDIWLNRAKVGDVPPTGTLVGAFTDPKSNLIAVAWKDGNNLKVFGTTSKTYLNFPLVTEDVFTCGDRLYVKESSRIHEVGIADTGTKLFLSTNHVANCMEKATRCFRGAALQNMLGEIFAVLFPKSGESYTVKMPQLNAYRIMDARMEGNVLMVVGQKKGHSTYDRLIFRFNTADWKTYDVREVNDITPTDLNFVVLESGVTASITENEALEIFPTKVGSPAVKVVADPMLKKGITLGLYGGKVCFWSGNELFGMKTK